MENPEFVSTALAKLREHFVVVLTPPRDKGGTYPCAEHGSHYSARHRDAPRLVTPTSRDLFETHCGFEGLLFRMKAAGTKVVFDLDTGLHEHEYERGCECP